MLTSFSMYYCRSLQIGTKAHSNTRITLVCLYQLKFQHFTKVRKKSEYKTSHSFGALTSHFMFCIFSYCFTKLYFGAISNFQARHFRTKTPVKSIELCAAIEYQLTVFKDQPALGVSQIVFDGCVSDRSETVIAEMLIDSSSQGS